MELNKGLCASIMVWGLLALPSLGFAGALANQGDASPVEFYTWEGFEVDKCASIWLIRRFIDKDAVIRILPAGERTDRGIAFDVPHAAYRRYHNLSTYESLLKGYRLSDPVLVAVGRIVHDVEINTWREKAFPETLTVMEDVARIIQSGATREEVIQEALVYFDGLYAKSASASSTE